MMTARSTTICILGGLAILLASAAAFQAGSISTSSATSNTILLRRAESASSKNNPCNHLARFQLHADPSQSENEPLENVDNTKPAVTPSKYDEGDPRQALEQFGTLFSLVQAIISEGSTWDSDKLEEKTQEFVRTYLRVFVPGLGYAVTSFAVFGSAFFSCILALAISGRGYADVLAAVSDVEPLRNLLEKADPAWGNAAIALIGCEVLGPVILGVTLALTPKTMDALQTKLNELGWGEDDIDKRAADILNLTS